VRDDRVRFEPPEGIIPAPEAAHAICAAGVEAVRAREAGEKRMILRNLSGHELLDLAA
jgi:tryptophan synthase beta chain